MGNRSDTAETAPGRDAEILLSRGGLTSQPLPYAKSQSIRGGRGSETAVPRLAPSRRFVEREVNGPRRRSFIYLLGECGLEPKLGTVARGGSLMFLAPCNAARVTRVNNWTIRGLSARKARTLLPRLPILR